MVKLFNGSEKDEESIDKALKQIQVIEDFADIGLVSGTAQSKIKEQCLNARDNIYATIRELREFNKQRPASDRFDTRDKPDIDGVVKTSLKNVRDVLNANASAKVIHDYVEVERIVADQTVLDRNAVLEADKLTDTAAIATLTADVAAEKKNVATLTTERDALRLQVATLNKKISDLEAAEVKLNAEIANAKLVKTADDAKIADLEKKLADRTAERDQLDKDKKALEAKVTALEADVLRLTQEVKDERGKVSQAAIDLTAAQTKAAADLTAAQAQAATNLAAAQAQAKADITAAEAKLQTQINTLDNDKKLLESQIVTLGNSLSQKQAIIGVYDAEFKKDPINRGATVDDVAKAQKHVAQWTKFKDDLKQQLADKQADLDKANLEVQTKSGDVSVEKAKVTTLEQQLKLLKVQLASAGSASAPAGPASAMPLSSAPGHTSNVTGLTYDAMEADLNAAKAKLSSTEMALTLVKGQYQALLASRQREIADATANSSEYLLTAQDTIQKKSQELVARGKELGKAKEDLDTKEEEFKKLRENSNKLNGH